MKRLLVIFGVLGAWALFTLQEIIPIEVLPDPKSVALAFKPRLLADILATVSRLWIGFILGIALAYFIHFSAMATNTLKYLDEQFAASRAIPVVALMPLFLLWFGFSEYGRVLVVMLTAVFYFLAPLQGAFLNLPREWTVCQKRLGLSSFSYYTNVVFPGTLSSLGGAFRVTIAICFTIAIASDYLGSVRGLGKFIDSSRVTYNVPGVVLAAIIAAAMGLLFDRITFAVHSRVVHWAGKTSKG